MAKKNYITFDINAFRAEQLHLNPKQFKKASLLYKNLTVNTIKKTAVDYDLILMKGQKGEVAYVRNDSYYRHHKITLVTEVPLSLTVKEQRDWIKEASKFFKPEFIAITEIVSPDKDFVNLKNKPYSTFESYMHDPENPQQKEYFKMRLRKYSNSVPYGSNTASKQYLKLRNEWMKKQYKILRKKAIDEYDAYEEIKMILYQLPSSYFGKWKTKKRNPHFLSIDAIQRIIQSKSF